MRPASPASQMRITSIQRLPRTRAYEVRIDHALIFTLSPDVLAPAGLRPGQEITAEQIQALEGAEARHKAMSAALRLLAYGPRSEKEMRDNLRRRKTPDAVAAETMDRLRSLRLLDDADFAVSYVEAKDRTSPRSRRMLAAELAAKGVPRRTRDASLEAVNEADAAYRAAAKKARALTSLPHADFQRRLGDYLLRRGFGYEVARATVRHHWEELHAARGAPDAGPSD
jgi:regulatory protein